MDSSNRIGQGLWNKIRSGRLTTTFTLLATLSAGILAGSMLTGNVSAKQQKVDSSDARQIVIPNPVTLSNGFSAIVKEVGPAVVNINTESLPKQTTTKGRRGQLQGPPDGDSQVPWGLEALNGAVSEPAWKSKPSWYLVATADRMIPRTRNARCRSALVRPLPR